MKPGKVGELSAKFQARGSTLCLAGYGVIAVLDLAIPLIARAPFETPQPRSLASRDACLRRRRCPLYWAHEDRRLSRGVVSGEQRRPRPRPRRDQDVRSGAVARACIV
jgi:hypothetical protein